MVSCWGGFLHAVFLDWFFQHGWVVTHGISKDLPASQIYLVLARPLNVHEGILGDLDLHLAVLLIPISLNRADEPIERHDMSRCNG